MTEVPSDFSLLNSDTLETLLIQSRRLNTEGRPGEVDQLLRDFIPHLAPLRGTVEAQLLLEWGRTCLLKGDIKAAFKYMKTVLKYLKALPSNKIKKVPLSKAEGYLTPTHVPQENKETVALAYRYLGLAYIETEQFVIAIIYWSGARSLWRSLDDEINVLAMDVNLGASYMDFALNLLRAEPYLRAAYEKTSLGNIPVDLSFRIYNNLTILKYRQGKLYEALGISDETFKLPTAGYWLQLSEAWDIRGVIQTALEQYKEANDSFRQALIWDEFTHRSQRLRTETNQTLLYISEARNIGDVKHKEELYNLAERIIEAAFERIKGQEGKFPLEVTFMKTGLIEVLLQKKQLDKAKEILGTIIEIAEFPDAPFFVRAEIKRVAGNLALVEGYFALAEGYLQQALQILVADPLRQGVAVNSELQTLKDLVNFYTISGDQANKQIYNQLLSVKNKEYKEKTVGLSKSYLANALQKSCSQAEIRDLCFHLGIEPTDLPNVENRISMINELIKYVDNRNRLDDLVNTAKQLWPHIVV